MAWVLNSIMLILNEPSIWRIMSDLLLFVSPLWIAVMIGLFVGWAWKPDWTNRNREILGLGRDLVMSWRAQLPSFDFWKGRKEEKSESSLEEREAKQKLKVTGEDLLYLYRLVEESDGGPTWQHMMDKSLNNFTYQAWRREPENGPTEYRSRTVFEDATPEQVRDFFWNDEFRIKNKWDDMLINYKVLESCCTTGTMLVHWVRKFPFFCSDREYIIGRRIWDLERTYFCVTKGVPCATIPRQNKPRRVDLYYSSWCIRAVESQRPESNGLKTACEVLLFHHEDMGIPREIAKLGIRQGMWGCVKRIEPGLRAYQKARSNSNPLSKICTKITREYMSSLEREGGEERGEEREGEGKKREGLVRKVPRLILIGGAVALACSFDQGLLTKAVVFGVARRFVWSRNRI
ncbi:hypothetical protein LUZ60_009462 [Juncus effusus]|nr:hypothetical protein LUZ60_009462 [Juncus effusus]